MFARTIPLVAALLGLLWPAAAHAFRLEPISRVFDPTGSGATQSFIIHNTSSERIAIEVSISTLQRDDDYRESNRPADDDFLVYPSQVIVAPGARQTVRVKWLGDPAPRAERAYRIVVEELPIDLAGSGASARSAPVGALRILMTYRGSLWVRPRGARPKLVVVAAAPTAGPDGSDGLAVTLRNAGTANAVLKNCRGSVTSKESGAGVLLFPTALERVSNTRILAGGTRRYFLPWPSSMPVGPVSARVSCDLSP